MSEPTDGRMAADWLRQAVLYQVYPQSFADGDGDGIGDLAGLEARLDHLRWLGVDTVWINPCWASPFGDAGYDVADYFTVAPRYGDNDALVRLFEVARGKGIRVLLDLVPGHTSIEHRWFRDAADDPQDHRYIWADRVGEPADHWVPSPGRREGFYLHNFSPVQPALNFGYARPNPAEPWRQSPEGAGPRANRAALQEVIGYWLERGASGFRVDMAFSLVKDDPDRAATSAVWRELRGWLDEAHPQAALLSEWGNPAVAVSAGFHADFLLHVGETRHALMSLWNDHAMTSWRWDTRDRCYFDREGRGTFDQFAEEWQRITAAVGEPGAVVVPTSTHDFTRLQSPDREPAMLPAAFAWLTTWPGVPMIYYGDEIGMRYLPDLPGVEGSVQNPTQNRTGSRTPMQWDDTANAGFSTAPAEALYLPVDPDPHRPQVAGQRAEPTSLLHTVRRLLALRRELPDLAPSADVRMLHTGYPLVYERGASLVVVVNPSGRPTAHEVSGLAGGERIEGEGVRLDGDCVRVDPYGWAVLRRPAGGAAS